MSPWGTLPACPVGYAGSVPHDSQPGLFLAAARLSAGEPSAVRGTYPFADGYVVGSVSLLQHATCSDCHTLLPICPPCLDARPRRGRHLVDAGLGTGNKEKIHTDSGRAPTASGC